MSKLASASALLFFGWAAAAEPIETHKKELAVITQKTEKFEQRIADLQARKVQAREGPELEDVLITIANLQKGILELRHERSVLRDHLVAEHPGTPLLFDKNLYKTFDKSVGGTKSPLDDHLDELMRTMESQYSQLARANDKAATAPEEALQDPLLVDKEKIDDQKDAKDRYLRDQLKNEMKVSASTESGVKKKVVPKKEEPAKEEPTKEEGRSAEEHH